MGKTPSSHIIHSLGGEYCWIARDCEPIRLLKSPRSLRVYILNIYREREQKGYASYWNYEYMFSIEKYTSSGNFI